MEARIERKIEFPEKYRDKYTLEQASEWFNYVEGRIESISKDNPLKDLKASDCIMENNIIRFFKQEVYK